MPSFIRSFTPILATVLALGFAGCSSDEDDDEGTGGESGGGSAGSGGSGTGGSGGMNPCGMACPDGEFCSACFNPDNPDEPLYACIADGTSC